MDGSWCGRLLPPIIVLWPRTVAVAAALSRFRTAHTGADVNHTDDCGETPLHVAIAADQAEIVSLLVGAGADTSLRNNEGYSCAELLVQSETCGQ